MKRKMFFLKSTLSIFLISSMFLTLFNCSANECKETEGNVDTENVTNITNSINRDGGKDYRIIQVEDGYRLVFDDQSFYETCESPQIAGFVIDSWEDFSDRLLAGALTLNEKTSMYYTSSKDENGIVILDPYVSYKISHVLPYQIENGGTYSGACYHSSITCDEQYTLPISVGILSKTLYDRDFEATFSDIDIEAENIEYEKKLLNNDNIKCYNKTIKTGEYFFQEKYVLSNDDKKVFILKTYSDDYDLNLPYELYVLVNFKNEIYFSINFSYQDITKDLTDEFLFGFNVEAIEKTHK